MAEAGNKRDRDEAGLTAAGGEDADATKSQKQEASAAAQQEEAAKITEQDEEQQPDQLEDVDAGDAAAGAGMDGADDEAGDLQGGTTAEDADEDKSKLNAAEPKKIGYKTFPNGHAAYRYYKALLKDLSKNQDLNEYEHHMVLDLLKQGHPDADRKMGDCLRAIQVREHEQEHSLCFHLMRSNGTMEDFSTNKCLASLFPNWSQTRAAKVEAGNVAKRGVGGRGRGRGFRGRRGGRGRGGRRGGRH